MKGILIDYEFCYGCHVCEMACKKEHDFQNMKLGIELHTIGPREIGPDKWEYTYVPVITDLCDMCADRLAEGKLPSCVHHCNAKVMEFGEIEELVPKISSKSKVVLYSK